MTGPPVEGRQISQLVGFYLIVFSPRAVFNAATRKIWPRGVEPLPCNV
jgi:hypothetical protein